MDGVIELIEISNTEQPEDGSFVPPAYDTPGRILVNVINEGFGLEFEVLDYDEDTGVFWINEGVGFDWWLEHSGPEFPAPGLYVIENIKGEYTRGDGWTTDDSEEWEYDPPRMATENERANETLDAPAANR